MGSCIAITKSQNHSIKTIPYQESSRTNNARYSTNLDIDFPLPEEFLPVTLRSNPEVHTNVQQLPSILISGAPSSQNKPPISLDPTKEPMKPRNLLDRFQKPSNTNETIKHSISLQSTHNPAFLSQTSLTLLQAPTMKDSLKNTGKFIEISPCSMKSKITDESNSPIVRFQSICTGCTSQNKDGSLDSSNIRKSRSVEMPIQVKKTEVIEKKKLQNGERFVNQYQIKGLLGCGAFSKVYRAIDAEGKVFAMKVVNKRLIRTRKISKTKTALNLMYTELNVLETTQHQNIVKLVEVLEAEGNDKIYIVLEYAAGGLLYDHGPFSEKNAQKYFRQLIEGIQYLHKNNIVHRDIKPQNILIDHNDSIKITNFSLAENNKRCNDTFNDSAGTFSFMAPEMHKAGSSYSGTAADIWAAGITLFYIIQGKTPYFSRRSIELSEEVMNQEINYPCVFSDEIKELFSIMLCKNPNNRATIQQIKESKWFNMELID